MTANKTKLVKLHLTIIFNNSSYGFGFACPLLIYIETDCLPGMVGLMSGGRKIEEKPETKKC